MGEAEGSSRAAQSAQSQEAKTDRGFLGRIIGALSPTDLGEDATDHDLEADPTTAPPNGRPGMGNLRRMRVEDVAVPRAEIASVATDTELSELVAVSRENG